MKILKVLLALLGIVGLVVAVVLLGTSFVQLNSMTSVANSNRSNPDSWFPNPFNQTALEVALGAAGGLLLGLGLGLPKKTSGQVRRDALDDVATQRQSSIAQRAAGSEQR